MLDRVTRKSKRIAALSATTTPLSVLSPVFTSARESIDPETPLTSLDSDDEASVAGAVQTRKGIAKGVTTRSVKSMEIMNKTDRKKRPTDTGDEDPRPLKKRAVSSRVYVSVPHGRKSKTLVASSRGKGKGKQKARETPTPSADDVSTDTGELSACPVVDGSEDSGSEFKLEEDSVQDEEVMLDAAVRLSLQTASRINGAGPSCVSEPSPAVRRRAVAAERRLAVRRKKVPEESDEEELEDVSDLSSEEFSWNLAKKGVTSPATKKVAPRSADNQNGTSYADHMASQKKARKAILSARRANRKEERALMQKLRRRLTHAERATLALQRNHPELKGVWANLKTNTPKGLPPKATQPADLKVTLLPFQLESLFWMRKQEKGLWHGGILADEMGMGKTIQIISLFISDVQRPNLVIAPTVAIMQWRNEIEAHTSGMKVLVWHGHSRESNMEQIKKYDVVLTTYAVLESCFRKQEKGFKRNDLIIKEKSPLHKIKWKRVVLDEAHNIKERSTNTAKAAFELQAEYRWCLSGTPLQNRVGELYSLVRFLGGDPFSYYFCKLCDCKSLHWVFEDNKSCKECGHNPMQHTCFWNNEILTPIQKHAMSGPGKDAFAKLRLLLDCMMLRRTKLQRADDLGLPPRTVIIRRNYFSPEEKEIYLSLFSDAKRQFSTYIDQGTILNNYSNIFSLLTRMRQMACHPDLVLRSKTNANTFIPDDQGETTVCRLCNDIAEDAIQARCRHIFDRECIKQYLQAALEDQPACPVCHLALTIDLEAPALELEENVSNVRQGILGRLNLDSWRSSSKIEALVEELSNVRLEAATTKSIVFSQFVNFLDLIAFRLQKAGFNICRLEGTMSPQARDATIQHFMNNVEVTVFLVSLKAGGVALNLTEASRVYLMDSWWNPAVEYQAMDRIHRLGQRRPVQAIKLVIEDSIESRIVQLQEKKSAMVDATLSTDDSAMGRLTPEDLGFLFRL